MKQLFIVIQILLASISLSGQMQENCFVSLPKNRGSHSIVLNAASLRSRFGNMLLARRRLEPNAERLTASGGGMSIADDLILNTKTGEIILNETKYGVSNTLRKNQKILQDAIKQGKKVELRSNNNLLKPLDKIQGDKITISEILRSTSVDGTITNNTIQSVWKK